MIKNKISKTLIGSLMLLSVFTTPVFAEGAQNHPQQETKVETVDKTVSTEESVAQNQDDKTKEVNKITQNQDNKEKRVNPKMQNQEKANPNNQEFLVLILVLGAILIGLLDFIKIQKLEKKVNELSNDTKKVESEKDK